MGHVRLGRLPTSRNWQEVVALLEQNAPVDAVAAGASGAAEIDLDAAASDSGFTRVCWLLAQIPLAARSPNFAEGLRGLGLEVGQFPDLFEIGGTLSDAVDRYVDGAHQRTDFGEMAQLAAAESLSSVAGRFLPNLFGSTPDDVQRAIGRLASGNLFGELAHDFFSRLTRRHLDYFLSRELANHIGTGRRFETVADRADFDAAMELHCREAARIVREFAGGWFGKAAYQRGAITEADAGRYAAYALKKIRAELRSLHVVRQMPSATEIDLRNRALIAFTLLTGARDGAIASLKLKHVQMEEGRLVQDAREVRTKFSKTLTTWFFPVEDEIRQIVADWVDFLRKEKLFGPADPLFPATHVAIGEDKCFQADGLSRSGWSNATPIRRIFKEAFISAGLPYANPHSFRNTLSQLGEQVCRTPEEFKAWSQNLGHEKVLTTFSSYGQVTDARQRELMRGLARTPERAPDKERLLSEIRRVLETVK